MKVMYYIPGKSPKLIEVENKLKPLQGLVDGYIEAVTLDRELVLICNEEGLLKGMQPTGYLIKRQSTIVGPCLIARIDGDEFTGLKNGDIEMISQYFEPYYNGGKSNEME